jgi:hypothetical protein
MTKRLWMALTAVVAAVMLFYIFSPHAAAYIFTKTHGLEIRYSRLEGSIPTGLLFRDLRLTDPKIGLGLFAEKADIKVALSKNIFSEPIFRFDLEGGKFLGSIDGKTEDYADLNNLVALPFRNAWRYKRISARLRPARDGMEIEEFYAESDEIRLSLDGTIYRNNDVKLAIKISFADAITSKIPEEFSKVILNDEAPGWKSLSVSLSGNFMAPSIRVSSKLFRLNIKSVTESVS